MESGLSCVLDGVIEGEEDGADTFSRTCPVAAQVSTELSRVLERRSRCEGEFDTISGLEDGNGVCWRAGDAWDSVVVLGSSIDEPVASGDSGLATMCAERVCRFKRVGVV